MRALLYAADTVGGWWPLDSFRVEAHQQTGEIRRSKLTASPDPCLQQRELELQFNNQGSVVEGIRPRNETSTQSPEWVSKASWLANQHLPRRC